MSSDSVLRNLEKPLYAYHTLTEEICWLALTQETLTSLTLTDFWFFTLFGDTRI